MTIYLLIILASFLLLPKSARLYKYSRNVLFLLDCAVNLIFLLGDYRETISSRIGRAHLRGVKWIYPIMITINLLFALVERNFNHCVNSIQENVGDKTLVTWKKR